jgi:small conductance mechanosensitive channel
MDVILEKLGGWEVIQATLINVVGAILIFVIGRWVARVLQRIIEGLMTKSKQEATLVKFVGHLAYVAMLVFVAIAAVSRLGIQTAQFIAVIGAAAFAIGLALQGSLANFAAGVLLIIFHPFKVGDFIQASGESGVVKDIQIFTTTLLTVDNKTVIIPNSKVSGENITNFTAENTRRVDMIVGVSYGADLTRTREVISEVLKADSRILTDPAPQIAVCEMADSSVNFVVRPWTDTASYWKVRFDTIEAIKRALDAAGIVIPFPQRDVHMYTHDSE